MAFEWKEYVELARFLQQQIGNSPNKEAVFRSAMSRAYYGAFCYVRNFARDRLGFKTRNDADDHGRLRERLKKGKMRGISDKLQRLREWRNECDYHDQLTFDPEKTLPNALSEASAVFAALPSPSKSTPPQAGSAEGSSGNS
jgi:hypothetical protein